MLNATISAITLTICEEMPSKDMRRAIYYEGGLIVENGPRNL
ncbi:hypothetical protein OHAE_4566 [Ochrobactrum soli]|uniref:Uncharacterized protein n=1 Tax=Ochrobactrum soli TaxID=2448455 RepID=A0A2P9HCD4_9HYPH|nr:hypothetical protein OHAE_4566 [[Ochrobactrum] soli]